MRKVAGSNKWNCSVGSNVLKEGVHECKVILLHKCNFLMAGVHNADEFTTEGNVSEGGNGCYLYTYYGTFYGNGETGSAGVGDCNQNGTEINIKLHTSTGDVFFRVNNGEVVNKKHPKGPWRFSFDIFDLNAQFSVQFN